MATKKKATKAEMILERAARKNAKDAALARIQETMAEVSRSQKIRKHCFHGYIDAAKCPYCVQERLTDAATS